MKRAGTGPYGSWTVVGAASGAVAGLAAVTPASGFVTVGGALAIGLVAGGLCYSATLLHERLRIDDALDVFAVHGVGDMFGAVATGVFATTAVNASPGLLEGNATQLVTKVTAVAASVAFSAGVTLAIVRLIDIVLCLRVAPEHEEMGLDLSVHGGAAYQS